MRGIKINRVEQNKFKSTINSIKEIKRKLDMKNVYATQISIDGEMEKCTYKTSCWVRRSNNGSLQDEIKAWK